MQVHSKSFKYNAQYSSTLLPSLVKPKVYDIKFQTCWECPWRHTAHHTCPQTKWYEDSRPGSLSNTWAVLTTWPRLAMAAWYRPDMDFGNNNCSMIEGGLEVKQYGQLKSRGEKSQKRKDQKKEDADARKGRKVAKHCVFPMICGSGGSKSRLATAAGAEPAGQMRDEKLHAVVARSTFPSQNVQNTSGSDHFWKLRCRKSTRGCGAKHISKSKC